MKLLRRNFLQGLLGIPAFKAVKDIEVMDLKEEDTLIVKCDSPRQDDLNRVYDHFKKEFPEHRVMVLGSGMDVKVLRNGPYTQTNK